MNVYNIERKRGFIYRVGRKCYFWGYKTCKECVDKEILDCFYKYEKLMNEIGKRYSEYDGNIRSRFDSFMENLTCEQQEPVNEQVKKFNKAWLLSLDKEIDDYRYSH